MTKDKKKSIYSKAGKTCHCCGHVIYKVKAFGYRCGPGCDKAEPYTSILDK